MFYKEVREKEILEKLQRNGWSSGRVMEMIEQITSFIEKSEIKAVEIDWQAIGHKTIASSQATFHASLKRMHLENSYKMRSLDKKLYMVYTPQGKE